MAIVISISMVRTMEYVLFELKSLREKSHGDPYNEQD